MATTSYLNVNKSFSATTIFTRHNAVPPLVGTPCSAARRNLRISVVSHQFPMHLQDDDNRLFRDEIVDSVSPLPGPTSLQPRGSFRSALKWKCAQHSYLNLPPVVNHFVACVKC